MLDRERQYYAEHLDQWMPAHEGRFVVIRDDTLVGIFDSQDEALSAGAARFGLSPFLVRRVGQGEETVTIPALTLGLLRADS
jgi:hypothetical protein